MKNSLIIPLGDNKIVAEIYDADYPEFPPEIFICLKDKDDVMIQDVCMVRPHYTIGDKYEATVNNNFVQCIVWGEPENEDYTDKHIIGVHRWEEDE